MGPQCEVSSERHGPAGVELTAWFNSLARYPITMYHGPPVMCVCRCACMYVCIYLCIYVWCWHGVNSTSVSLRWTASYRWKRAGWRGRWQCCTFHYCQWTVGIKPRLQLWLFCCIYCFHEIISPEMIKNTVKYIWTHVPFMYCTTFKTWSFVYKKL